MIVCAFISVSSLLLVSVICAISSARCLYYTYLYMYIHDQFACWSWSISWDLWQIYGGSGKLITLIPLKS